MHAEVTDLSLIPLNFVGCPNSKVVAGLLHANPALEAGRAHEARRRS